MGLLCPGVPVHWGANGWKAGKSKRPPRRPGSNSKESSNRRRQGAKTPTPAPGPLPEEIRLLVIRLLAAFWYPDASSELVRQPAFPFNETQVDRLRFISSSESS
ncbi:hypothetical protein VUR80DRAFT_4881 [Thermomyces stellatus]